MNGLLDFKLRVIGHVHFHATEVTVAIVKRTYSDCVGHFVFAHIR